MRDLVIAVVGGDRRQSAAARALAAAGLHVRTACLPGLPPGDPLEALSGADAWLLPPAPVPSDGTVGEGDCAVQVGPRTLRRLRAGARVLCGRLAPAVRAEVERAGCVAVEYAEREDFAAANAELTAEGALAHLLVASGRAIAGCRMAVLGYGRCGQAVARKAAAWGAHVTVVARSPEARRRAAQLGFSTCSFEDAGGVLAESAAVVNTVPAQVLGEERLACLGRDAYVLDLASAPGGVDWEAARRRGVRAEALPGVPGRLVPETAGRIVASVALTVLRETVVQPIPGGGRG
ncbi:MAG: NAD(P)-binding domain-containing protein [Firmicutes bacterium]|nr:NAD(P)-binding domain-containing protein [Bacillota bacterium]